MTPCIHRGRIVGDKCECYSNRFAGADFALRPLSLCEKPCPYRNKPDRQRGLGDTISVLLASIGITKARYSRLIWWRKPGKGCGCTARAALLNRLVNYRALRWWWWWMKWFATGCKTCEERAAIDSRRRSGDTRNEEHSHGPVPELRTTAGIEHAVAPEREVVP